jgi:hypothetical protein
MDLVNQVCVDWGIDFATCIIRQAIIGSAAADRAYRINPVNQVRMDRGLHVYG